MKKNVIASVAKQPLVVISAACLLVACGDTVENVYQSGMEVVASADDLPKCSKDNEDEQIIVKDEASIRICIAGDWVALEGVDGDYACKTEELKDGSGLKIVCNGDSIGVVLNGSDGKDGKSGKDGKDGDDGEDGKDAVLPNDTLEVDSERVAVSLDSLAGYSQKGPFLKGSTVYLYELSDGRTLKQTNGNFTSIITRDDGRYKFTARDLASQYAMIVVEGYYRNEVTGKPSNASIRLRAITDMRKRSDANINLLTHLEFDRVYYLVTREKKSVKQAKAQAQKEILKAFHIDTTDIKFSAEDLDVFGKTDADAALLAISVLLQGDGSETDLSVLLTEIANDMETDGKWDGENADSIKAAIADWAATADTAGRLDSVFNYVKGWGLGGGNVPDFKKFVRNFWYTENKLGACGDSKNPLGTVKEVSNENSRHYYAKSYGDTEKTDVRFICDSTSRLWRPAINIEKDTATWGVVDEGTVLVGQINRNLVYVFQDNHWRRGTEMDRLLKKKDGSYDACLKEDMISDTTYEGFYYWCKPNVDGAVLGWTQTDAVFNETYEYLGECKEGGEYSDGRLLPGLRLETYTYFVCDDGSFRRADKLKEVALNKGCTSYNRNTHDSLGVWHSSFTCTADGWVFDPTNVITDTRDALGRRYKTIKLGEMYVMAENLNFATDSSFCYGNISTNCSRYGRLYAASDAYCNHLTGHDREECMDYMHDPSKINDYLGMDGYIQGVCPIGWHIPNRKETEWIVNRYTAKELKSSSLWNNFNGASGNGSDRYGFNALPAGYGRISTSGAKPELLYGDLGSNTYFWTTYADGPAIMVIRLSNDNNLANHFGGDLHDEEMPGLMSVRCIMDEDFWYKLTMVNQ